MLCPLGNLAENTMKRIEAVIDQPVLKPTSTTSKRKNINQSLSTKDLGIIPAKKPCTAVSDLQKTINKEYLSSNIDETSNINLNDKIMKSKASNESSSECVAQNKSSHEDKVFNNDENNQCKEINSLQNSLVGDYGSSGSESEN